MKRLAANLQKQTAIRSFLTEDRKSIRVAIRHGNLSLYVEMDAEQADEFLANFKANRSWMK